MKKMKEFCCSSNVALATFSQRLLAEKPQMVDLDKRDRHSIYIRTVSSQLPWSGAGIFFFLTDVTHY